MIRRSAAATLLGLLVSACGLPGFEPPVPQGVGPDPVAPDTEPIGPVVEIGRGESLGVAWRYLVYESRMGTCTEIEYAGGGGPTGCGGSIGPGPAGGALALSGISSGTGSPSTVEGWVGDEVAQVWIESADGARFPATIMSLKPVGVDGGVFFGLVPGDRGLSGVVALDADGIEIAREVIDGH